jgi:hypothetical protein
MTDSFFIKLILSFLIGSAWVVCATIITERFGSKVGGIIGGFPSTVAVSLLFIGLARSPELVVETTTLFPAAFAVNAFFILCFVLSISRGAAVAFGGAIAVWFLLQYILVVSGLHSLVVAMGIWLLVLFGSIYLLEHVLRIPSCAGVAIHYRSRDLLWRAGFSGTVIVIAVSMGSLGGPALGAMFSSFPAVFLSTLFIAYRSLGQDCSRGLSKSLLIGGLVNCVVYALLVRYLYPRAGLAGGTLLACALTSGVSLFTLRLMSRHLT